MLLHVPTKEFVGTLPVKSVVISIFSPIFIYPLTGAITVTIQFNRNTEEHVLMALSSKMQTSPLSPYFTIARSAVNLSLD